MDLLSFTKQPHVKAMKISLPAPWVPDFFNVFLRQDTRRDARRFQDSPTPQLDRQSRCHRVRPPAFFHLGLNGTACSTFLLTSSLSSSKLPLQAWVLFGNDPHQRPRAGGKRSGRIRMFRCKNHLQTHATRIDGRRVAPRSAPLNRKEGTLYRSIDASS